MHLFKQGIPVFRAYYSHQFSTKHLSFAQPHTEPAARPEFPVVHTPADEVCDRVCVLRQAAVSVTVCKMPASCSGSASVRMLAPLGVVSTRTFLFSTATRRSMRLLLLGTG